MDLRKSRFAATIIAAHKDSHQCQKQLQLSQNDLAYRNLTSDTSIKVILELMQTRIAGPLTANRLKYAHGNPAGRRTMTSDSLESL
jgi:hypothetical protein